MASENPYFDLTEEFNAEGRIALLASGQAVVFYRLAIMSKDGDWVLRETPEACRRVLAVLESHGARYRAGAPLDVRWLAAGWSSHFEMFDERGRRLRCDFFTRPPRVDPAALRARFEDLEAPAVVDVESLVRMKQTQRAKDYAVIGELARRLPTEKELELTTDPDRIRELVERVGAIGEARPSVKAARESEERLPVVLALAAETDALQQADRWRLESYSVASEAYMREVRTLDREALRLPTGHERLVELAESLLPTHDPVSG